MRALCLMIAMFSGQVDVAVVEVGIGGTYDSTNVIKSVYSIYLSLYSSSIHFQLTNCMCSY